MDLSSIGKRTKYLRKTLKLKQSELALITGMSQGGISSVEQDKLNLTFEAVLSLYDYLNGNNISFDWFLIGEGEMMKSSSTDVSTLGMSPMGTAIDSIGNTPLHKTLSTLGASVAAIGNTPVQKTFSKLGQAASSIGNTPLHERYNELGEKVSGIGRNAEDTEDSSSDTIINVEGFSELRKDEKILIKCYRGIIDEAQEDLTDYAMELYRKKGRSYNDKPADLSHSGEKSAADTGFEIAEDLTSFAN